MRLGPFYREFRVGLLVRCHFHCGDVCGLSEESGVNFGKFIPYLKIVNHGLTVIGL